jgi:Leucine-rich repeat (LRR) protein
MPQELLELTALVTLDLSHNSLTVLPPQTFHTWSTSGSLQRLDLSHNQLVQLPEELCQVTSLQELLLHHNDLQLLPAKVSVRLVVISGRDWALSSRYLFVCQCTVMALVSCHPMDMHKLF